MGEWKDGKKHGSGILTLSHGSQWVGEWKNGEMDNGKWIKQ